MVSYLTEGESIAYVLSQIPQPDFRRIQAHMLKVAGQADVLRFAVNAPVNPCHLLDNSELRMRIGFRVYAMLVDLGYDTQPMQWFTHLDTFYEDLGAAFIH